MLCSQSDTFDVPVALSTILQLRETNSFQRTLVLQNLTASDIAAQIERSADGGSTWALIGTAFTVGAVGGGSDVQIQNISATYASNIIRIRCSGGGNDRDLNISFMRMYLDATHIWSSPLV